MPAISERMTYRRYNQIKRYLHYCDEETAITNRTHPEYDVLYKVRSLYNHIKQTFAKHYQPHEDISVDECMIPFNGRWGKKQYDRSKPIRWGIKVYMACDASNGYAHNIDIYTGKDPDFAELSSVNIAAAVVMKLVQDLWGQGYHIYTDRFYTSPLLLHWLRMLDLTGTGTCMTNRKHFPQDIIDKKDLTQGNFVWKQCQTTGIVATRWTDKRPIYLLSNGCKPTTSEPIFVKRHNKRGEVLQVPATPSVVLYNKYMGGVDLNDKMAKLDKSRKSYKWYTRIDRKCISWSMFNAYVLYSEDPANPKIEYRDFMLKTLTVLIGPPARKVKMVSNSSIPRLVSNGHFPVWEENASTNNRCVVCEKKHKIEKKAYPEKAYKDLTHKSVKTCVKCSVCTVYLCVKKGSTCFQDYHSKVEFWR